MIVCCQATEPFSCISIRSTCTYDVLVVFRFLSVIIITSLMKKMALYQCLWLNVFQLLDLVKEGTLVFDRDTLCRLYHWFLVLIIFELL